MLRGLQSRDLNVLIDGQRVYGACPNHMDPAAFHVDFAEVDRVEVGKGPFDVKNQGGDTTPTVGEDTLTKVVVYSRNSLAGGVTHPADILYQRTSFAGVRFGSPIRISNDTGESTDDRLNDISGSRVVYTALEAAGARKASFASTTCPTAPRSM